MKQAQFKPLATRMRADLFQQLATMEKAGLPADKAIALLRLAGKGNSRLEEFRKLLSRGTDIATAGQKSGLFTAIETSLVRAALHAGSPANTYRRLADILAQQAQQIATAKSRMMMPLTVFAIALFVNPLPSFVAGSLSISSYLLQIFTPLLLLFALFYLVMQFRTRFEHSEHSWLALQLTRFPLFGKMHVRRNHRDFFVSLALLLEAGVPMFDALPKAIEAIGNGDIRQDFSRIKRDMMQGATFAKAIEGLHYVGNEQVAGYIQTGEESGTLPEMLLRFVNAESAAIAHFQQQLADWLPRLAYSLVALWMAYTLLTGSAFMPNVPKDLQ